MSSGLEGFGFWVQSFRLTECAPVETGLVQLEF